MFANFNLMIPIPISEAIKYPVGTRFILNNLDEADAHYSQRDAFLGETFTWTGVGVFDNGDTDIYFSVRLPNTTFTLINE